MTDGTINQRIISQRHERLFFTSMCVAIALTVFIGFAPTFFLRPLFHTEPLVPLLILHGVVFTAWIALLLVQTTLIATRRTRIHRRLGIAGAVLAVLLIVVGTTTAIIRAQVTGLPGSPSPLVFLTIPLGDMLVFGILVGCAFYFRHRADTHKRLMILATIAILPAAVARLPLGFIFRFSPLAFFAVSDLFIVPCLIYDFVVRGRPHRATVLGGLLIVVSHPLRFLIGNTDAWINFATWLTHWTR